MVMLYPYELTICSWTFPIESSARCWMGSPCPRLNNSRQMRSSVARLGRITIKLHAMGAFVSLMANDSDDYVLKIGGGKVL